MADFKQINEARKLLGLGEKANLQEIKEVYRKLSLRYHPDHCQDKKNKKGCEDMFKRITSAKDILMTYCVGYYFSFKEEDVEKIDVDKAYYEHIKRFYDGWLGDLNL